MVSGTRFFETQMSNGVVRLDPTDHKYIRTGWWIPTQTLETLKTQSCINIVGKRCKVCYINSLLNISHSNINKSVIPIRIGHFMSSVFVNPGIYSCAVDAFLEISTHSIFFSHVYQVYVWGMILQTSFSLSVHIICVREKTVHYWGKWSYIIDVCSSFSAGNCNACLSLIFEKRTFGYLSEEDTKNIWFFL